MATLALQKCLNHGEREAAARCPECRQYFCRECVSEHAGRVLCAQCLEKTRVGKKRARSAWRWAAPLAACGVASAWLFFFCLGKTLLLIPSSFHDGAWFTQAPEKAAPKPHAKP